MIEKILWAEHWGTRGLINGTFKIRDRHQSRKKRGHRRPKRYYRVEWEDRYPMPPLSDLMRVSDLSEFDEITEVYVVRTK